MIKDIHSKELINTELFIREPVDNLCREIDNNPSKRIILSGERGAGKSTVLYTSEHKGLGDKNGLIYTRFDSAIMFENNEIFNERFLNHYYELVFSEKLLYYIERYYPLTYQKNY